GLGDAGRRRDRRPGPHDPSRRRGGCGDHPRGRPGTRSERMSLAPDTFTFVADLVRRRSAIQLDHGKEYLVESRLLPLARAAGLADVDAYVRQVRAAALATTLEVVVEALTTNETSWLRDAQP